ncbi:hypothetical protein AUEXF2481DRAFT_500854 [Aureobasidium subglaciale EXF-2481]|uniref:Uncharacterized protein n=1 Tax=Aureobasidium subglaciale (strain EXF-2481) TaxID=1043005 RepID=A0A074YWW7_AURSE|nr:uncharacterized protein AUEXF2481DRAFT_500854 [Aureobasidium subglaciale EXF-2481]KEQ91376.1 hypothetical protein AUEXF2481DRAFT_500854 [Aureobasidium subglaciale EXF-2481]
MFDARRFRDDTTPNDPSACVERLRKDAPASGRNTARDCKGTDNAKHPAAGTNQHAAALVVDCASSTLTKLAWNFSIGGSIRSSSRVHGKRTRAGTKQCHNTATWTRKRRCRSGGIIAAMCRKDWLLLAGVVFSRQRMTAVVQRLTVEGAVQGARLTTRVQCKDETERAKNRYDKCRSRA